MVFCMTLLFDQWQLAQLFPYFTKMTQLMRGHGCMACHPRCGRRLLLEKDGALRIDIQWFNQLFHGEDLERNFNRRIRIRSLAMK